MQNKMEHATMFHWRALQFQAKLTLMDPAAFFFDGDLTAFSASGSAGGTIRRSQTRQ